MDEGEKQKRAEWVPRSRLLTTDKPKKRYLKVYIKPSTVMLI
jgi:hypothetical protein